MGNENEYEDLGKPPMWEAPKEYVLHDTEYENSTRLTLDERVPSISFHPDYGKEVGYYKMGGDGIRIYLLKKPSWIARTMTRVLLEWYWVDIDKKE